MCRRALLCVCVLSVMAGCQTSKRGVHTVPVVRDYDNLTKENLVDAEALVARAQILGASTTAPYEFYSAERYLELARRERVKHDRRGAWDYAALATRMAQAAIDSCAERDGVAIVGAPDTLEAAQASFERVRAVYRMVNQEKAIAVSPILYAHLTVALSQAEHELNTRRHWRDALPLLATAEADLSLLQTRDRDEDGIVDLQDGAPREPEDEDNFQDADGIPDPDNDRDGVPDENDVAPNEPEIVNHWRDYDGAPDTFPSLMSLQFEQGQTALSSGAKGFLRGIALLMANVPDLKLRLRGHSSDVATDQGDFDLSRQRAEAVQRYLHAKGVPDNQLVVTFLGATESSQGAAYQRVELVIE